MYIVFVYIVFVQLKGGGVWWRCGPPSPEVAHRWCATAWGLGGSRPWVHAVSTPLSLRRSSRARLDNPKLYKVGTTIGAVDSRSNTTVCARNLSVISSLLSIWVF